MIKNQVLVMNDESIKSGNAQEVLNKIVLDYLQEQKRQRFWRWVKRSLGVIVFLWVGYQVLVHRNADLIAQAKPHVGLIDIQGPIFDNQTANGDSFAKSLQKAYDSKGLKALIIRIDSPGGSPVQADYMFSSLRHYQTQYPDIKTYAVCMDSCTSAAYYVAAAADEIYANQSSIVGSIGVLYNGFGFVDAIQKLGVSRRVQTAGRNKAFLDPFLPENTMQENQLQTMLDMIHQRFIQQVKAGRGTRLKIDNQTFSGLFWTGMQAKERGLIDGFGSSGQIARERVKIDHLIDYTHKENVFDRVAKSMGTAMVDQLPAVLGMKPGFH